METGSRPAVPWAQEGLWNKKGKMEPACSHHHRARDLGFKDRASGPCPNHMEAAGLQGAAEAWPQETWWVQSESSQPVQTPLDVHSGIDREMWRLPIFCRKERTLCGSGHFWNSGSS